MLYEVAPALIRLSVARPPQTYEQAVALAAELATIAADKAPVTNQPLQNTADELLTGDRSPTLRPRDPDLATHAWDIHC